MSVREPETASDLNLNYCRPYQIIPYTSIEVYMPILMKICKLSCVASCLANQQVGEKEMESWAKRKGH